MRDLVRNLYWGLVLALSFTTGNAWSWQLSNDSTYRRTPGFVSSQGPYRPTYTRTTDLVHTSLKLRFDWAKQEVDGHAVIALTPYFYPQDSVVLDARAFQIVGIERVQSLPTTLENFGTMPGLPLSYTYDSYQIRIALGKTYTRDDTLFVSIRYKARPEKAATLNFDGRPVEKGLYFINPDGKNPNKPRQLWTQGETTGGSSWFPTLETPNEKFTQDVFVTVEEKQLSVSNGLLLNQIRHPNGTRTDHWHQSLPHAPYLVALVVGDFFKASDTTADGMEVSYYVDSTYAPYARKIFGRTPDMISFFSKLFDVPYPWEKYAQIVVKDFVSGAMENTTATILQEETHMVDRDLIDGNSDALIAHELAHHWFGNLVTCEDWGQLPLNESFANYAEYLWEEHRSGKAAADWSGYLEALQYFAEAQTKRVDMIRYFYENPDHMFDSHSYAKGGRILHMLRNYVGDEAFFKSLSHYLKKKQFGTAELADLRLAFEEITGKDLNWFFDQWFYRPGHPELIVSHHYLPAPNRLTLRVQQVQDRTQSTLYRLPIAVEVWVKGQKRVLPIVIDRPDQEFNFVVETAPDLVRFDSQCQLLGTVDHEKSTAEWLYQLAHTDEFLARYEALTQLSSQLSESKVRDAFRKAMQDPFWKIRQEAFYRVAEYEGPGKKDFEPLIKSSVTTDPHPQVRGEALLALKSYGIEKYGGEVQKALNDSSYAVVATAISLSSESNKKNIESIIARFSEVPNEYIAAAVGDYYGDHPSPAHFTWYTNMLNRLNPSGCYALLQVFGKYLIRSDAETQQKGLVLLEQLARDHAGMSVRYGAYQLLSWFDDRPGVKDILQELKNSERNPQLLDLYKGLEAN
jgi:aminopeptidase N